MLAYILVCLALPRFLRRIGELTAGPLLAGVGAGAVLCYVFVAYTYPLPAAPYDLLLWVFAALVLGTLGWQLRLVRRDPRRAALIGVYDEPVLGDLFDPGRVGVR
jgi:hypothetical protein